MQMMVVVGGKYFIFPAGAAAGRPALALGHHLTLLPRGPAAEQTVGAGSQRSSTSTRPPPPPLYTLLISALGRQRQTPAHASSSRKQVAAAGRREQVRPPGLPASQCPPLLLPRTPPNRPLGSMMGGESASPIVCVTMRPPFITPRPLPTLRRGVRIRKFWCPVSGGFPPDHLLPGAMGHRSLHCLGAGPAQDPRPPIQAPPACQASSQHNYHDPGFQIHIEATQLVPCFPPVLVT